MKSSSRDDGIATARGSGANRSGARIVRIRLHQIEQNTVGAPFNSFIRIGVYRSNLRMGKATVEKRCALFSICEPSPLFASIFIVGPPKSRDGDTDAAPCGCGAGQPLAYAVLRQEALTVVMKKKISRQPRAESEANGKRANAQQIENRTSSSPPSRTSFVRRSTPPSSGRGC